MINNNITKKINFLTPFISKNMEFGTTASRDEFDHFKKNWPRIGLNRVDWGNKKEVFT